MADPNKIRENVLDGFKFKVASTIKPLFSSLKQWKFEKKDQFPSGEPTDDEYLKMAEDLMYRRAINWGGQTITIDELDAARPDDVKAAMGDKSFDEMIPTGDQVNEVIKISQKSVEDNTGPVMGVNFGTLLSTMFSSFENFFTFIGTFFSALFSGFAPGCWDPIKKLVAPEVAGNITNQFRSGMSAAVQRDPSMRNWLTDTDLDEMEESVRKGVYVEAGLEKAGPTNRDLMKQVKPDDKAKALAVMAFTYSESQILKGVEDHLNETRVIENIIKDEKIKPTGQNIKERLSLVKPEDEAKKISGVVTTRIGDVMKGKIPGLPKVGELSKDALKQLLRDETEKALREYRDKNNSWFGFNLTDDHIKKIADEIPAYVEKDHKRLRDLHDHVHKFSSVEFRQGAMDKVNKDLPAPAQAPDAPKMTEADKDTLQKTLDEKFELLVKKMEAKASAATEKPFKLDDKIKAEARTAFLASATKFISIPGALDQPDRLAAWVYGDMVKPGSDFRKKLIAYARSVNEEAKGTSQNESGDTLILGKLEPPVVDALKEFFSEQAVALKKAAPQKAVADNKGAKGTDAPTPPPVVPPQPSAEDEAKEKAQKAAAYKKALLDETQEKISKGLLENFTGTGQVAKIFQSKIPAGRDSGDTLKAIAEVVRKDALAPLLDSKDTLLVVQTGGYGFKDGTSRKDAAIQLRDKIGAALKAKKGALNISDDNMLDAIAEGLAVRMANEIKSKDAPISEKDTDFTVAQRRVAEQVVGEKFDKALNDPANQKLLAFIRKEAETNPKFKGIKIDETLKLSREIVNGLASDEELRDLKDANKAYAIARQRINEALKKPDAMARTGITEDKKDARLVLTDMLAAQLAEGVTGGKVADKARGDAVAKRDALVLEVLRDKLKAQLSAHKQEIDMAAALCADPKKVDIAGAMEKSVAPVLQRFLTDENFAKNTSGIAGQYQTVFDALNKELKDKHGLTNPDVVMVLSDLVAQKFVIENKENNKTPNIPLLPINIPGVNALLQSFMTSQMVAVNSDVTPDAVHPAVRSEAIKAKTRLMQDGVGRAVHAGFTGTPGEKPEKKAGREQTLEALKRLNGGTIDYKAVADAVAPVLAEHLQDPEKFYQMRPVEYAELTQRLSKIIRGNTVAAVKPSGVSKDNYEVADLLAIQILNGARESVTPKDAKVSLDNVMAMQGSASPYALSVKMEIEAKRALFRKAAHQGLAAEMNPMLEGFCTQADPSGENNMIIANCLALDASRQGRQINRTALVEKLSLVAADHLYQVHGEHGVLNEARLSKDISAVLAEKECGLGDESRKMMQDHIFQAMKKKIVNPNDKSGMGIDGQPLLEMLRSSVKQRLIDDKVDNDVHDAICNTMADIAQGKRKYGLGDGKRYTEYMFCQLDAQWQKALVDAHVYNEVGKSHWYIRKSHQEKAGTGVSNAIVPDRTVEPYVSAMPDYRVARDKFLADEQLASAQDAWRKRAAEYYAALYPEDTKRVGIRAVMNTYALPQDWYLKADAMDTAKKMLSADIAKADGLSKDYDNKMGKLQPDLAKYKVTGFMQNPSFKPLKDAWDAAAQAEQAAEKRLKAGGAAQKEELGWQLMLAKYRRVTAENSFKTVVSAAAKDVLEVARSKKEMDDKLRDPQYKAEFAEKLKKQLKALNEMTPGQVMAELDDANPEKIEELKNNPFAKRVDVAPGAVDPNYIKKAPVRIKEGDFDLNTFVGAREASRKLIYDVLNKDVPYQYREMVFKANQGEAIMAALKNEKFELRNHREILEEVLKKREQKIVLEPKVVDGPLFFSNLAAKAEFAGVDLNEYAIFKNPDIAARIAAFKPSAVADNGGGKRTFWGMDWSQSAQDTSGPDGGKVTSIPYNKPGQPQADDRNVQK